MKSNIATLADAPAKEIVDARHAGFWCCSRAACVIDLDNILHRGFEKSGAARPQAQLDILRLSSALRERGITRGTICRNREFPALAEQLWDRLGFKVVAARKNCDDAVIDAAKHYAQAGVQELVLVGGDDDYRRVVTSLRAQGVRVEIWSRRAKASEKLISASDAVRYIDDFIIVPIGANSNARAPMPTASVTRAPQSNVLLPDIAA